jgi:phosphate transport system permease protein
MKARTSVRRRATDVVLRVLMLGCLLIALIPLGSILATAMVRGGSVISWQFLSSPEALPCTPASCVSGGIWPAIEGTFIMLAVAALIAMPLGIFAGIYLSEFGQHRFGRLASFVVDVLSGVPSIIVGLFVFSLVLLLSPNPEDVYSALSGSLALAVIMLPVVVRTTEESLRLVPRTVREAAAALGIHRYKATLRIVLTKGGEEVITGDILDVAGDSSGSTTPPRRWRPSSTRGARAATGTGSPTPGEWRWCSS